MLRDGRVLDDLSISSARFIDSGNLATLQRPKNLPMGHQAGQ